MVLIVLAALYFFMGFYNVSAINPHSRVTEIILHSVSESSIKRNASGIKNPYDVNDRGLYLRGFNEYEEMCVQCHGWTGIEPSVTGKGLNPKPPGFPEDAIYEFTLEEIFWVTKNGIKMTGMPAYGPTHDDKTIWSISIFLDRSRDLTEEGYKKLKRDNAVKGDGHNHAH